MVLIMSKSNSVKRKFLKVTAVFLAFVLLLSAAMFLLNIWDKKRGFFPTQQTDELSSVLNYKGQDYEIKDGIETVLLMGLDKFEGTEDENSYNNDRQADFILLCVIDSANSKCTAVNINRDSMVDMNVLGVAGQKIDTVNKQLALAHTYGNGKEVSCRNVSDAVSNLLMGMEIDHYISLTMDSVATLNDLVGGVEVTVLDDFTGIDDALIKGEKATLKGEQALRYVRTRYGLEDSTNSTRMERQKQYLTALHSKAKECAEQDEEFIVKASVKMADYMVSDYSVNQLQVFLKKISEYGIEINSINGKSVLGEKFMEFYPDKDSITQTVIDLFYEPKK